MSSVTWVGPFRLRDLLERCMVVDQAWPPEKNGVYVVSERAWRVVPMKEAGILYTGGNTSASPRFLVRVGELITDLLGFFTDTHGRHSGGASLWFHCRDNNLHPLDLYLGWAEGVPCPRCSECEVYRTLEPLLCRRKPAACKVHREPLSACFTRS
jgi:hypothetical protein